MSTRIYQTEQDRASSFAEAFTRRESSPRRDDPRQRQPKPTSAIQRDKRSAHPVQFHVVGKRPDGTLHYTVRGPADIVWPGNIVTVPARRGLQRVAVGDVVDETRVCASIIDPGISVVTAEIAPQWFTRAKLGCVVWAQIQPGARWLIAGPSDIIGSGHTTVTVTGRAGATPQRIGDVIVSEHGVSVAVPV